MRGSGILFHISSIPSPYGIGTFGRKAYEFVDFLNKSNQKYWQVLPIGPTSYGDSPYQTFSAFAGNPYFIDLDILKDENLLREEDLENLKKNDNNVEKVDYEYLYNTRYKILKIAYTRFISLNNLEDYNNFIKCNEQWLDDYSLFMSIKESSDEGNWHSWKEEYTYRNKKAIDDFKKAHYFDLNFWKFVQYEFFKQWNELKKYANSKNVKIIGDMPIYVAYDSCDVWSNPKYWKLDSKLNPTSVAGCPPDYFSKTGQLWGNPLYNYDSMEEDGFSWWICRIDHAFKMFDVVRIDHFRGFEAFYSIPYAHDTAEHGVWVKGPGYKLFKAIKDKIGEKEIIAEDLGFLTKEVHDLLDLTGFPGMKVLQFAFNPYEDSDYLPHNYPKNSICYTGTHDNMTLKEWLSSISIDIKEFCYQYAGIKHEEEAIDRLIRCLMQSHSNTVIIPLSDYLELGEEGRFNIPSTLGGNWVWRLNEKELTDSLAERIKKYTIIYKR